MMSKRPAEQDAASRSKKQKFNGATATSGEPVVSARQLQQLLSFHQDRMQQLRHGIKSFKSFLESILYAPDKTSTVHQQTLLSEFLESQASKHAADKESPFLTSLMQAWSLAAQANNDSLLSAIPAILALLLKTVSGLIDLRTSGLDLCKTLLLPSQAKLISKTLSAPKHKEHIISPCLRLLTEIVTFDGGTLASKVFAAKAFTFDGKILARNLSLWKAASDDSEDVKRRPAVRTNAVRYVLASLKHLSSAGRTELVKYGNVIRALFEHIRRDPINILQEILESVKTYVLMDDSIPRSIKRNVLNDHNLAYVANFYRLEKIEGDAEQLKTQPDKIAHNFLAFVCTDPRAGILRPYSGWYPPGTDKNTAEEEQEDEGADIDLGIDSIDWYNRFHDSVPVRNIAIAKFAQSLRPHANVLESELLVKILGAAPELVADYFFKKSSFEFDPKLTATWIGYSSFLFSTVKLPVPAYFGSREGHSRIPPPASIVVESILPQPLTQKALTKCLNQQIELVTFFAVRLLCAAFQKLRDVLAQFKTVAITQGSLWNDGADRVVDEFIQRCPKLKDVIKTFHKTKADNLIQREAVLRLISLYYQVTPQVTQEEKFDVSIALADALDFTAEASDAMNVSLQDSTSAEVDMSRLQLLTLNHLLQIAHRTPDMRWWYKPESLKISPFMKLLKMVSTMSHDKVRQEIYLLIDSIMKDHGILQQETETPALQALIASLKPHKGLIPSKSLDEFVDDTIGRLVRKPTKYEDDFDVLSTGSETAGPVSLLIVALAEQWPFAVERANETGGIAFWLGRYLLSSLEIGEDERIIRKIHDAMQGVAKNGRDKSLLIEHVPDHLSRNISYLQLPGKSGIQTIKEKQDSKSIPDRDPIDFELFGPSTEDPKHRGLHRWSTKDIPSAVSEGDLSSLILCLSSTYPEVRQLALANLRQFSKNLDAIKTTYPEAEQIYLLIGILINTVTPLIQPKQTNGITNNEDAELQHPAVSYFCTVYAVLALQILQTPLHPLYPKINAFHTRSPKWSISHLPSYWAHQILFTPPTPSYTTTTASTVFAASRTALPALKATVASTTAPPPSDATLQTDAIAHINTPTHFLLTYIYHALRTPTDLALLRARGTFEPILALAANPFLPHDLLLLVLQIVARATCIEGGSTLLITRAGVVAWLGALVERAAARERAGGKGDGLTDARGLRALLARVWETCDRDYVDTWSGGAVGGIIAGIVGDGET